MRGDIPVPSLGIPLLATVPPLTSVLEELSEMSFMLTAAVVGVRCRKGQKHAQKQV